MSSDQEQELEQSGASVSSTQGGGGGGGGRRGARRRLPIAATPLNALLNPASGVRRRRGRGDNRGGGGGDSGDDSDSSSGSSSYDESSDGDGGDGNRRRRRGRGRGNLPHVLEVRKAPVRGVMKELRVYYARRELRVRFYSDVSADAMLDAVADATDVHRDDIRLWQGRAAITLSPSMEDGTEIVVTKDSVSPVRRAPRDRWVWWGKMIVLFAYFGVYVHQLPDFVFGRIIRAWETLEELHGASLGGMISLAMSQLGSPLHALQVIGAVIAVFLGGSLVVLYVLRLWMEFWYNMTQTAATWLRIAIDWMDKKFMPRYQWGQEAVRRMLLRAGAAGFAPNRARRPPKDGVKYHAERRRDSDSE